MDDCIFCKIIKGDIPSHKVYEDANFLGILSISPEAQGHALVIPKKHYRWVWDVANAGEYFEAAKKIALAQKKAFGTDFVMSRIVGEEVPHAHIHVWPEGTKGDKKNFAQNAQALRANM